MIIQGNVSLSCVLVYIMQYIYNHSGTHMARTSPYEWFLYNISCLFLNLVQVVLWNSTFVISVSITLMLIVMLVGDVMSIWHHCKFSYQPMLYNAARCGFGTWFAVNLLIKSYLLQQKPPNIALLLGWTAYKTGNN